MVTPLALLRQPSALDLADAEVLPGGGKRYLFREPEDEAKAAAEQAAMAQARAASEAEQTRVTLVAALCRDIISEGDDGGDATLWLAEAQHKLAVANEKRVLTADADALVRSTTLELETLLGEVRADIDRWLRYEEALPSTKPDTRQSEQDRLRAIIREAEPLASRMEDAALTAEVAHAVVAALEDLQPIRRARAWLAAHAPEIEASIQRDVASLQAGFATLAAMEAAADVTWDQRMRMRELGVRVADRRLRDRRVDLPPLLTCDDALGFEMAADPRETEALRIEIAQQQSLPSNTAVALVSPPPFSPSNTPGAFVARAIRLFIGEQQT